MTPRNSFTSQIVHSRKFTLFRRSKRTRLAKMFSTKYHAKGT